MLRLPRLALGFALAALASAPRTEAAPRVVSLNPSLSSILVALGAAGCLVGVDDYSARELPELAGLPRVGGLRDPSLEAIVALDPELVVLVPSEEQRELREGLARLEVPQKSFDPRRFDEVLAAIEELGRAVGHEAEAAARVATIRAARARIAAEQAGRPPVRGVLVITHEPLYLAGDGSFVDDMLKTVGVENLARALGGPWPRASLEWLVAQRPELILDADADAALAPAAFWSRWPSLPAVAAGRVVALPEGVATLPGPWLDRALELLARAVRGPAATGSP
jgi:iron complex transport system substrate-binding protein